MNSSHDHDWALPRLSRFATGTLAEAETLQLQAHLDTCADCQSRLAPVRAFDRLEAAHLPASLVATWARSAKRLSALERELVGKHLSTCSSCRETLEFAGHAAVLPAQVVELPARRVQATNLRMIRNWAYGLSGIAAAAAVWMLVVQPQLGQHDPRTVATIGGAPTNAGTVTFEPVAADARANTTTLLLPAIGLATTPTIETSVRAMTAGIVLVLPAGLVPASEQDPQRAVVVSLSSGEGELGRLATHAAGLGAALRMRSVSDLAAGLYLLRFSVAGRDVVYQLDLR